MKIAVLQPVLETNGGAELVIYHLCLGLDRKGHEVSMFTDRVGSKWGRDLDLILFRQGAERDNPLTWQRIGKKLASALTDYDVVLCHNYPSHIWYHYAQLENPAIPPAVYFMQEPPRHLYYETMHADIPADFYTRPPLHIRLGIPNWRDFLQKRMAVARRQLVKVDQQALASVNQVIVNSNYVAGWVRKIYDADAEKVMLGIRTLIRPHLPPARMRFILTVTRLELLKNLETLLRAFPLVQRQVPKINLVMIGVGDDQRRLMWLRNRLCSLKQKVIFRGWVSDEELLWLYRRAMLFAFIPVCEPYGLVNLEAMACGLPVVTSNFGGPSEAVPPAAGMHVPPFDVEAVAQAMITLLHDDDLRKKMGEAGQEQIKKMRFTDTVDEIERRLQGLV